MGNCLGRKSSSMVWAGDEWDEPNYMGPKKPPKRELNESLLGQTKSFSSTSSLCSSPSNGTRSEVKIKISKKQLEELLGRVEVHHMPADQVLSSLIDASDQFEIQHQRSWRPTLQSIPEMV